MWTIVTSDAAAGAASSNTLRLNAAATSTTDYLSSQVASWGTSQEWGVWIGRRAQAYTAANQQYFWLYANESTLNNATVDGYRIAIGDDTGGDEIRLEYIVNGAVSATVITSSGALTNGLTDVGFLVRVTRSNSGLWTLSTSTLPTANGAGAIATDVPNSTNASVSQGSATNNVLVPAANGYLGVAALHSTGANALVTAEFDQIYFTPSSSPTITGTATATAFTTTYGTASAPQTFTISGSNLTADLVATPPTGFEVSSDGTNYASTATFTQSGGSASGSLRIRLTATAAASTSAYNAQNIVLSSTGATSVNITTAASGNSVSQKALTITGLTGADKTYDGSTVASVTGTAALSGVVAADAGNVTLGGPGSFTFATAAVGTSTAITASGYTISGSASSNYSLTQPAGLTANITVKALTVTANNVTKSQGQTLTGGAGSTAFTSSGLVTGETIGSVTITYGTGASAGDPAATYPGQVTPSAATGGTFAASNYSITYVSGDLTVSADPTITTSGAIAVVNTTYGTATPTPASFTVGGGFLTGDLTVTCPSGFEISSGGSYSTSLTLLQSGGTVSNTTIFVRLAATTVFGTYSGNVSISGGGASTVDVASTSSTVSKKVITITGLLASDKSYDGTTTVSVTGTPSYVGLVNGETFSVTGSVTWAFSDSNVGANKALTQSGLYTAPSTNYTVTQPILTASITAVTASAPAITGITAGNGQLSAAFTAPTSNGGSAITTYKYSTDGGATFIVRSSGTTASPIVITTLSSDGATSLTNGTTYNVQIKAVNLAGDGTATASTAATPITTPGAPTITSITAGNSQLSVAFTAPASNGGSPITNYKYSTNGGTSFTAVSPASTSSPIVITGLSNGTTYNVQIRAVNAAGDGTPTASTAATPATPPKAYYLMSQGDYSADFSDIANWTDGFAAGVGSDYWASVSVNASGTIPDGVKTTVSSATFNATTGSGGVQRGGLAGSNNPAGTFVLLSTGTGANGNAVAVDLLLDFTGRNAGTLSFDYSCVFNSTGNRGATLKVYTSTDGSTWTELTAAAVSVINNVALSGTKSLITLPASLNGNATAKIRFYEYADAIGSTGSRPKVSIDNIAVTSIIKPTITTGSATSVAQTTATLGGNITATGGASVTERGAYWSTSSGFADGAGTKISATGTFGTGSFTVNATGLTASTTYYFKAYAVNSAGTSYGTEGTFTTLDKTTPNITSAPTASAITYGQTLASSILTGGTADVPGAFAFTTPATAPNAGNGSQSVTFTPTDTESYNTSTTNVSVTVNPATLAPGSITISENAGVFSASSPGVSGFTLSYSGRSGTTYGPSATAPTATGFYTVTATSADRNYTGSNSLDYFIAGPIAVNDNVTKPGNNAGFKIPLSTLLANDIRIDNSGALLTTGLTVSAVQSGAGGNTVSISGAFVLFTPGTSGTETFTYTLSDGTSTATGAVTVSAGTAVPITLDILRVVVGPTYNSGTDTTDVTVELAGVPNETYLIQYSTDLSNWSSGVSTTTGTSGTFNFSATVPGNQASFYFRATR